MELVGVLRQQLQAYEALLEMARAKTGLVVDNNIRDLEILLAAEEACFSRAGRLESLCQSVQSALAEATDLPAGDLTLTRLTGLAPAECQDELRELGNRLCRVTSELQHQNRVNGELLKQALSLVNYQLSLLAPDGLEHVRRPYVDRKA
jgi:flagellar biosynthesis/type III secretory pathway chaperone